MPLCDYTCRACDVVLRDSWATTAPLCRFCSTRMDKLIARGGVRDDSWIGGKTFENLGHDPVTFYSKTDYRRYLKTHGIEEFHRHTPPPGTDKSDQTTSWASVTQETLDGAAAMLERVGQAKGRTPSYVQAMDVTTFDEQGRVEATWRKDF
jgi:hypothetical protein